MISVRKEEYYLHLSKKLNDLSTSSKTYWSILKSFYNGSKVPLIPPLLVNNKFVSDFTKKPTFSMIFSLPNVLHYLTIVFYHPANIS